jgi:hypothetical protein
MVMGTRIHTCSKDKPSASKKRLVETFGCDARLVALNTKVGKGIVIGKHQCQYCFGVQSEENKNSQSVTSYGCDKFSLFYANLLQSTINPNYPIVTTIVLEASKVFINDDCTT